MILNALTTRRRVEELELDDRCGDVVRVERDEAVRPVDDSSETTTCSLSTLGADASVIAAAP